MLFFKKLFLSVLPTYVLISDTANTDDFNLESIYYLLWNLKVALHTKV